MRLPPYDVLYNVHTSTIAYITALNILFMIIIILPYSDAYCSTIYSTKYQCILLDEAYISTHIC